MKRLISLVATFSLTVSLSAAEPIAQDWEYAAAMKKVAAGFKGREGVVLHVGDSITHANPYGQWASHGEGRTDDDKALLTPDTLIDRLLATFRSPQYQPPTFPSTALELLELSRRRDVQFAQELSLHEPDSVVASPLLRNAPTAF